MKYTPETLRDAALELIEASKYAPAGQQAMLGLTAEDLYQLAADMEYQTVIGTGLLDDEGNEILSIDDWDEEGETAQ